MLLAKNIDAVYSADPKKDPNAVKYDKLSYMDFISQGLAVMDTTAVTLCMDNDIPIMVFGLDEKDSLKRAVSGETIGTVIS